MKNCFADINNCNNFQYFVTFGRPGWPLITQNFW